MMASALFYGGIKIMTRTFIALEMNANLQSRLARVIRQLAQKFPEIRWVDPTGIHLTLAFLGELDDEQLAAAQEAAEKAAHQVPLFSYHLSRLGTFGAPQQPRVVWMGIEEPAGLLIRVHRVLNHELRERRFEVEKRPFAPHFTLARIKSPLSSDDLQRLQALLAGTQTGLLDNTEYPAQRVAVMKSELLRGGAHYTVLREYLLQ
jgi:2'-5' RNA ligase